MNTWTDFINLIPPCLRIDSTTGTPPASPSLTACLGQSVGYWTLRLSVLAGIISFVYLVVGGFQMATAVGDEQRYGQGKKTVISALIGLAISLSAGLIVGSFRGFLKP